MNPLSDILKRHDVSVKKTKDTGRKRNTVFEEAEEFGAYVGLNTIFVLRLFKTYGKSKVLALRSWIADYPNKNGKSLAGLVVWKLKNDSNGNKSNTNRENTAGNVSPS